MFQDYLFRILLVDKLKLFFENCLYLPAVHLFDQSEILTSRSNKESFNADLLL